MGPRATCVALVVALLTTWASGARAAPEAASPLVRVELLGDVQSISPGETFWVGLRQQIAPGWHTYWVNPGDSGEPARVEWALPAGFIAGEIAWPYPERIPVGPAMSYGYEREVVLPVPVTAPRDLAAGARHAAGAGLVARLREDLHPRGRAGGADPAGGGGDAAARPRGAPLIAAARRAVPTPSPWPASFVATPETVTLGVDARDLVPERIAEVWFYPARWGLIEHAAPHMSVIDKTGMLMYAGAIDDRPTSRRGDVQGAQNYVREALQAVAAGQPVKTPVTRAYGCTVKYA
ncbi:MAG TPA: protein-disulfide reductase DsbD domain-containing protein [Methylomirabilota bacterium]